METDSPLEEQAESLRYYLAGCIHVVLLELAAVRFRSPVMLEVVEEDKGIAFLTTRSGTKYKISVETVDIGGAPNDQQEAGS